MRPFLALAVAFAALAGPAFPASRPATAPLAVDSAAAFDASGRLVVLTTAPAADRAPARVARDLRPLALPEGAAFPTLRADRDGRLHAAYVQSGAGGDVLRAGPIAANGGFAPGARALRLRSAATALDSALDTTGAFWTAWADQAPAIRVREDGFGREWSFALPAGQSVPRVVLAPGPAGSLWMAWTQAGAGGVAVFARRFDGGAWSPAEAVPSPARGPALFPAILAGAAGGVRVFWSGFVGNDYEIFTAWRTPRGWSAPAALTRNGAADSQPVPVVGPGGRALVLFARSGPNGGLFVLDPDAPGRETALARTPAAAPTRPRAALRGDRLEVVWSGAAGLETAGADLRSLRAALARASLPGDEEPAEPADPAALDDDTFVGFGDSITYGTIAGEYHPERGYLPRLEAALEPLYGPLTMVNEGRSGEITINGMGRFDGVLAANGARYYLIMEGTNDVVFQEIPMEATAFHLEQMLLKALRAGAYPVLSTIIPRDDWRWDMKLYRDRIFGLNQNIRRLAENLNVPLVDMYETYLAWSDGVEDWTALISDGVHPTDEGYEVMAGAWRDEIRMTPFPPRALSVRRQEERALLAARSLNVVSWQHSPRLTDFSAFTRYVVLRRDLADPDGAETVAASLLVTPFQAPQSFTDTSIGSRRYRYRVRLVRLDRIEGPPSDGVGN